MTGVQGRGTVHDVSDALSIYGGYTACFVITVLPDPISRDMLRSLRPDEQIVTSCIAWPALLW